MRSYLRQAHLERFILMAVLYSVAACAFVGPGGAAPTVKIGLIAPVEGRHRPLGYEALFGVKLAVQERNSNGGVNGYGLELVILNDFDDPAQAKIQAKALAADPAVLGVVGHLSAATTRAALPVYQAANLAVSAPWTMAASDLQADQSGLVSVAATEAETSARLRAVGQALGFDNFVTITDNHIGPDLAGVPALQLATDAITGGELILALDQTRSATRLFGGVDIGSPQLLQTAGPAAEGLIYVSPGPDPRDVAGAGAFIEGYQALAGFPPGPRAVLAYDAANVLLEAIEQAIGQNKRRPTRAEVGAAIRSIEQEGISGQIAFNEQGQRIDAPVWVYQIFEGNYPGTLIRSE